jgi:sugar lactone lactonase YvrE
MRRIQLLVALVGLALLLPLAASSSHRFPDRINLPNGWQPEGIAIGKGPTAYVGSIPTGRIWQADLRTGNGFELVPNRGRRAIGVEFDRLGRLFVAGGPTGDGYVYDARTGADIAQFNFTDATSFVNDVVVTRRAAWFTDSSRPFLYKVRIGRHGRLGPATAIPLTGDIVYAPPPQFNANGIDATPNGKKLIIAQSNTGKLFTVDKRGVTDEIDLGGATVAGDGILLHGRTLYVVTRTPSSQVVVIRLSRDLSSGRIVRSITHPDFRGTTTVDRFGAHLYVVNARFGEAMTPETPYWVTRVRK